MHLSRESCLDGTVAQQAAHGYEEVRPGEVRREHHVQQGRPPQGARAALPKLAGARVAARGRQLGRGPLARRHIAAVCHTQLEVRVRHITYGSRVKLYHLEQW